MSRKCMKCEEIIPNRVSINNKRHVLKNRTHCLSCVPFQSKTGNGKMYSKWSEERKARHRAVCAAKGLKRKQLLVEYKGGKCQICGYNKCLKALHFHHRVPSEKLFELHTNSIKAKNWDLVLIEADKCDLVCSNCHAEIHNEDFSDYINVKIGTVPGEGITNYPCVQCGVDRKHKSLNNLCDKCSRIKQRRVERPSLETLKEQIENIGYSATGRFYGVSDNAIRKWIKQI